MKLLYLVHRLPYPPDRGDRIRSWHLLRFFAERAEVDLACLADESVNHEQRRALAGMCRRVAIVTLGRARWYHAARSLAGGRSATEGLFYSRELNDTLAKWAGETRYDRVVAFCSSMNRYLDLPALADVPKFVDLVDVDSQKWFDYSARARGFKRVLFSLEGRRVRRLETELARKAEALLVVSGPEANLLRGFCPTANVHAVANGVDLDYFQGDKGDGAKKGTGPFCAKRPSGRPGNTNPSAFPAPPLQPQSLVFVGALDYRANIDGVTWFCREVWPRVQTRYPNAIVSLVGRNPQAAVRELATLPGVKLVGQVPDVRPFMAAATAAIAPLRVARGLQNKVLEGAAMGKPVISTSAALEGFDLVPGEHVLRADSPDEWLSAISLVFEDPAGRERLGAAGQLYVQRHHAWSARLAPLADLLGLGDDVPLSATHEAEALSPLPLGEGSG
ncbi:MAG TPA: glycosyltransferase [Pirellulales bacterium]|nr:glycosyltransferase [Pirellulales bacterium]